uniref:Protein phosphatase 1 regulatory subunit 11 n=1 Tax=Parascaris univalens TaxID=6257 RepID=A0A914ZEE1_PARUN
GMKTLTMRVTRIARLVIAEVTWRNVIRKMRVVVTSQDLAVPLSSDCKLRRLFLFIIYV